MFARHKSVHSSVVFFLIFLGLVPPTAYGIDLGTLIDQRLSEEGSFLYQDKFFSNFRAFANTGESIDPHKIIINTTGDLINPGLIFNVDRHVGPDGILNFSFLYDVVVRESVQDGVRTQFLMHDNSLTGKFNVLGAGNIDIFTSLVSREGLLHDIGQTHVFSHANFFSVDEKLFDETTFPLQKSISVGAAVNIEGGNLGAIFETFEQRFSQNVELAQAPGPPTALLLGSALLGMILWRAKIRPRSLPYPMPTQPATPPSSSSRPS